MISHRTIAVNSSLTRAVPPYLFLNNTRKNVASGFTIGFRPHLQRHYLRWSSCSRERRRSLMISASAKSSEPNEDRKEEKEEGVETLLKFYSWIKERNVIELAEVIEDKYPGLSNTPYFKLLRWKKLVLCFFDRLIGFLRKHVLVVIRPTLTDGMAVDVLWRLEWNKVYVPLGKGFRFNLRHVYKGMASISNAEMLMEPLLHLEPLRLKIMEYATSLVDAIHLYIKPEATRKRTVYGLLLGLPFMAVILFFTKPGLY